MKRTMTIAELREQNAQLTEAIQGANRALATEIHAEKEVIELMKENTQLIKAVRWALGEEGDFGLRPAGAGTYWWRSELRRRAGL